MCSDTEFTLAEEGNYLISFGYADFGILNNRCFGNTEKWHIFFSKFGHNFLVAKQWANSGPCVDIYTYDKGCISVNFYHISYENVTNVLSSTYWNGVCD